MVKVITYGTYDLLHYGHIRLLERAKALGDYLIVSYPSADLLWRLYDKKSVLDDADNTKYIVFVLCAVILVMNIIIISTITLLNMYHSAKEIALMRLIGISMKRINLLYIIQNSLIGLVSTLLAFALSRLCLLGMGDYVADMGVVLNLTKVYPAEILILVGIFVISVVPTVIWTAVTARRDGISE